MPKRRCDRGRDDLRILDASQLDQPDAIREVRAGARQPGQLKGEPALADAAHAGKGEQPGASQADGQLGEQTSAADEAGGRLGQVVQSRCGMGLPPVSRRR